jgi:phenylalanyl-tRNA synthetase beta chain
MKISLKWLKEFVDIDVSPLEIDKVLTDLGIEVEKIIYNREKYNNFFIGEVLKSEFVEGSDHLHYCEVTTGKEQHKVICGAPNVAVGQKVIIGIAGAIVPVNGLKLEKRKIKGYESNGMICSPYELEISEDHSGILVLPNDAKIGMPLYEYLDEDDVIFEISITPNRGDCLSHLGIAREIAAFYKKEITFPAVHPTNSSDDVFKYANVIIESKELNPRYTAKVVKNVTVKESPDWLKKKLNSVGLRPINNIVDVTNLILMEINQPLHAFDLDRIANHTIIIRHPQEGEKFITLDSKERILDSEMLMICDNNSPIAIAGVMGGENTEISEGTKNVLIESAYFNPSSIRRTAKKLGIQSEAAYRFERGVDYDMIDYAANRAAELIAELSGGEIVSGIIDVKAKIVEKNSINLNIAKSNKIIGYYIPKVQVIDLLHRLNFKITEIDEDNLIVVPPSYRNDIEIEIDVIEEIARLYGYDNIEPQYVSQIDLNSKGIPVELSLPKNRNIIRNFFANRGFNEILTQNMIEPKIAMQFDNNLIEIANPLGEELSIMRPSMLPSVLKSISNNIRVGNSSIKFFEIGKIFLPSENQKNFIKGISEEENLIVALYGENTNKQWGITNRNFDFFDIKGIATELFEFLKVNKFKFISNDEPIKGYSPNSLSVSVNKQHIGVIGEVAKDLLKQYDIEKKVYVFELQLNKFYDLKFEEAKYQKISPFPPILRDLAFIVDKNIPAGQIFSEINSLGGNYLKELNLFDLYEGKSIPEGQKSIAFNLVFSSDTKTLTDAEIEPLMLKIIAKIETKFQATLRKI